MTWSEFLTAVRGYLPVDADRLNVGVVTSGTAYLDLMSAAAVKDLQKFIESYRLGHETTYTPDDLAQTGAASQGELPDQAALRSARYEKVGQPTNSQPLTNYDWANRMDLVSGNLRVVGCQYAIAIDPYARNFIVYPKVAEGRQIRITWDGTRITFADTDEVPFGEDAAECVAEFVAAHIERKVNKDLNMFNSYMLSYKQKRALLYVTEKERRRLKELAESEMNSNQCLKCAQVQQDDTEIEFVAFGDSGEQSSISETGAVAQLVKNLEPDFVVHLGDSSYPTGADVYLADNLVKFYNNFIDEEKFYLAVGNHDLDADNAAALWDKLAYLAAINSGKLYYNFVVGPCEFFVLNGNLLTTGDTAILADGVGSGSAQETWLTAQLAASGADWKIVTLHFPPYCSDEIHTPGTPAWQLDFAALGADLVLSGHAHNYERLLVDGFPYLVCGLGGAEIRGFDDIPVAGSQFRYNTQNGVLRIAASATRLQSSFYTLDGEIIDTLVLRKD